MIPDHTAPMGAVWSGFILFAILASKGYKQVRSQTTKIVKGVGGGERPWKIVKAHCI